MSSIQAWKQRALSYLRNHGRFMVCGQINAMDLSVRPLLLSHVVDEQADKKDNTVISPDSTIPVLHPIRQTVYPMEQSYPHGKVVMCSRRLWKSGENTIYWNISTSTGNLRFNLVSLFAWF